MAKIVEFIETETHRGQGTEADPHRLCAQLWTKEGVFVAEYDPVSNKSVFNPTGVADPFVLTRQHIPNFSREYVLNGRTPITVLEDTKEGA